MKRWAGTSTMPRKITMAAKAASRHQYQRRSNVVAIAA
jgi:hypothetical protein